MKLSKRFILSFVMFFSLRAVNIYAAEYTAFSLNTAKEKILSVPPDKNYREIYPEVFNISGITVIKGFVYDRDKKDIIVVGEKDNKIASINLDDFVVALKSELVYKSHPSVNVKVESKDKEVETCSVTFIGGVENTQLGQDLLDADYKLKQMGIGIVQCDIPGFKSYWDILMEKAKECKIKVLKINLNFWFQPTVPFLVIKDDVAITRSIKAGAATEILSADIDGEKIENILKRPDIISLFDGTDDEFAKKLRSKFEKVLERYPSFSRLLGLSDLVILAKAVEEIDEKLDLSFWLENYKVKNVKTDKEVKALKRSEKYTVADGNDAYYGEMEINGEINLSSLVLHQETKDDVAKLKKTVLESRPKPDTLSWQFGINNWSTRSFSELFDYLEKTEYYSRYIETREDIVKSVELQKKKIDKFCDKGFDYIINDEYDKAINELNKAIEIDPKNGRAYQLRGDAYNSKKQYDQALINYNKAIEIDPKRAVLYNSRGYAYVSKGEYDRAIADFSKAIEIDPDSFLAYHNRGWAYGQKGEYDQAIIDIDKVIEGNPKQSVAYSNRGMIMSKKGEYAQALLDFNKAIEMDPLNCNAYFGKGDIYFSKSEYNQAINEYNKCLEINPEDADAKRMLNNAVVLNDSLKDEDNPVVKGFLEAENAIKINPMDVNAYVKRGDNYILIGKIDEAISDFNRAIELDSTSFKAHYSRAFFYAMIQKYDQALADYTKAIEIEPNNSDAYSKRATVFLAKKEVDKSIADLNKAIELEPKNAEAYNSRAVIYYGVKYEYAQAMADLNKVIEINPKIFIAYGSRGILYLEKGEYDLAIADFNKAIELAKDDSDSRAYYKARGMAYLDIEEFNRAVTDFTKLIEMGAQDIGIYKQRALGFIAQGEYDKALSDFNKAIKINPQDDEIYSKRGRLYNAQGKYNQALADFNKALQINAEDRTGYNNRGLVYFNKRQYDLALADFDKAIAVDSTYFAPYNNRAHTYFVKGDYENTLADFSRALEIRPKNVYVHYNRGLVYYYMGRQDQAILDFNNAKGFDKNGKIKETEDRESSLKYVLAESVPFIDFAMGKINKFKKQDEAVKEEVMGAKHILLKTQEEADEVLKLLNEGASFEDLAMSRSYDKYSAGKGGDLGIFNKGDFIEEFEKAVESLKIDEKSNIIKTDLGYHIIIRTK